MNTFDLYPIQKNSQENIYNTINSFFLKYVYIFTFLHFINNAKNINIRK